MPKAQAKSKKKAVPDGYLCSFTLNGSSHSSRSEYNPQRRQEVHKVRKLGACLRCQLLKKSCSSGNPCTTCIKAAAKRSASRSLAWMECIRPSLLNVSIYGSDSKNNLKLGGVPVLQYLAHGNVSLRFDIPFQWNIDELSAFVAGWLVADHDAPRASMVGIMSSASLLSVISEFVDPGLSITFKTLIYRASLIFNAPSANSSDYTTDAKVIRHCGQTLLAYFDSVIRPLVLSRLSKHELYALFLLLLGCVISTKYVSESLGDISEWSPDRILDDSTDRPPRGAHKARELVKLLSHQMAYIGLCTGLLQEGTDEDLILSMASSSWRKQAVYNWEAIENVALLESEQNHIFGHEFLIPKRKGQLLSYPKWDDESQLFQTIRMEPLANDYENCMKICASGSSAQQQNQDAAREAVNKGGSFGFCLRCVSCLPPNIDQRIKFCARCREQSDWKSHGAGLGGLTSSFQFPISNDYPSTVMFSEAQVNKEPCGSELGEQQVPSSPLDLAMAAFDPEMPTQGIDMSYLGIENVDFWSYLNQMQSPTPSGLFSEVDWNTVIECSPQAGLLPWSCSEGVQISGIEQPQNLESAQRRLLI